MYELSCVHVDIYNNKYKKSITAYTHPYILYLDTIINNNQTSLWAEPVHENYTFLYSVHTHT